MVLEPSTARGCEARPAPVDLADIGTILRKLSSRWLHFLAFAHRATAGVRHCALPAELPKVATNYIRIGKRQQ